MRGLALTFPFNEFALSSHETHLGSHKSWLQNVTLQTDPTVKNDLSNWLTAAKQPRSLWQKFQVVTHIDARKKRKILGNSLDHGLQQVNT